MRLARLWWGDSPKPACRPDPGCVQCPRVAQSNDRRQTMSSDQNHNRAIRDLEQKSAEVDYKLQAAKELRRKASETYHKADDACTQLERERGEYKSAIAALRNP